MNLGRVIGTVVATQKYEGLTGCKLLLVQPLDHEQRKAGDYLVAVDTVRAGFGELIYFVNSREAALALEPSFVPVDAAIVGIVDDVAADPLPPIDADLFFHHSRPATAAKDAAPEDASAKDVPDRDAVTPEAPGKAAAKAAPAKGPARRRR